MPVASIAVSLPVYRSADQTSESERPRPQVVGHLGVQNLVQARFQRAGMPRSSWSNAWLFSSPTAISRWPSSAGQNWLDWSGSRSDGTRWALSISPALLHRTETHLIRGRRTPSFRRTSIVIRSPATLRSLAYTISRPDDVIPPPVERCASVYSRRKLTIL